MAIETGIAPNALIEAPPAVFERIVARLDEREREAKAQEMQARLRSRARGTR